MTIVVDALLEPISATDPSGPDLREVEGNLLFESIAELRTSIEPGLDPSGGDGRPADWPAVVRACEGALAAETKDLELAAYLTEGWMRERGLEGLCDGVRLLRGLLERFWPSLHPGREPDGIDAAARAKYLSWLGSSRALLLSLGEAPLVRLSGEEFLTWAQRERGARLDAARLKPASARSGVVAALEASGAIPLKEWDAKAEAAPSELRQAAWDALVRAREEWRALGQLCRSLFCEDDRPSDIGVRDRLDEIAAVLGPLAPSEQRAAREAAELAAGSDAADQPSGESRATVGVSSAPIRSRADALERLALVAAYFRRTEPHSPVSYLIERAVRWSDLPLEVLLKELVKNPEIMRQIFETLGMEPSQS